MPTGDFYQQEMSPQTQETWGREMPFEYQYQGTNPQREKITPYRKLPSLLSRVALAFVSVISVLMALQVTLEIHGIMYDNNVDPGNSTHLYVNIVFILFVFFVAFSNFLYNRTRH